MENSTRYGKASHAQSLLTPKQIRSGYEPSDTENEELEETPWNEHHKKIEDMALRLRAKFECEVSSPVKSSTSSLVRRRHSKSPYKPRSPNVGSEFHRNASPLSKPERWRHISPHLPTRGSHDMGNEEMVSSSSSRRQNHRSLSVPKPRSREKEQRNKFDHWEQKRGDRTLSPLARNVTRKEREGTHKHTPSGGEINEMVANAKISRGLVGNATIMENTECISLGDIFFSRDFADLTMQKISFPKNGGFESRYSSNPHGFTEKIPGTNQRNKANNGFKHNTEGVASSPVLRQTTTTSSSTVSRQSSTFSDISGRTDGSSIKFAANRQKRQTETWFSCIKAGSCRTAKKSPERERAFDEASFIEKAFVVENLRQFLADKHRPVSLDGFTCHKQEAQLLKQIVSHENCPHILLKGPPGSGKKALTMALLHEIYGDPARNISHELKYFQIQETRPMQVVVPVTASAHHVELNLYLESNARYALMALVKQISSNYIVTPEVSNANFKADYTVMVLYDVDKAAENIQHLIKWIMDCYTDACKLILCCEDDVDILKPLKNRCKVIKVDAPVTHEIMEVLIQIARKENFDLSMSFAAKIATKSKQNMRKAIMALEACKAHNYPFAEDQPIPMGWEEVLVELAAEILADPSPKRLFFIRGKFQKLLGDFVHPKLILQKLIEQFLKEAEASLKRELYYWHAYYDKRLPVGTSAVLKLEEFVAKFMSIYRKNSSNRQFS